MASTARKLFNHYETLQVTPTANSNEIVEAFASQMRSARLHPEISISRLAQLSVAYETLRDPAKRRAYDAALGLKRDFKPIVRPAVKPAVPPAALFTGGGIAERLSGESDRLASSAARNERTAPRDARLESRLSSYIADSVRQPVKQPEPDHEVTREAQSRASWRPESTPEPVILRVPESADFEDGRSPVSRTYAMLAAAVVGAGILAYALLQPVAPPDRLPAHLAEAQSAVTVPLPPAAAVDASPAAPQTVASSVNAPSKPKPRNLPTAVAEAQPAPGTPAIEGQPAQGASSETLPPAPIDSSSADVPADAAAAGSAPEASTATPPAVASAARLPLGEATIAQTIKRIGFACGEVTSASAVEGGASGVYKITCSSGDTYRASPVRGRYHFRRWNSR